MGFVLSKVFSSLWGNKEVRVLILGLDNAGKTTVLYKLDDPDKVKRTMPTIGFNVKSIQVKNLQFSLWDLGGQSSIRPYWRCYYQNANAIVFVVDSADRDRISIAKTELMAMLEEEELKKTILLCLANKQDQADAMTAGEVAEGLGLTTIKDRPWHITPTVATRGEGLEEGFGWLSDTLTGAE